VNNPAVPPGAGRARICPPNPIFDGLPGRANATIRSPAAALIDQRPGIRHGAIASFNALICRVYLLRETALPDRVGQGKASFSLPSSIG
jgi:hypothetical protein